MKVSVIIPTYKPGEYIWECLDSLDKQVFPKTDFEVILVLNGCKEPYYSQLKEYIAKSNVQYNFIHTDEGGVSNARNIALDNVKGEYITFIDDDDIVSSTYLVELYSKASPDVISLSFPMEFKDEGDLLDECFLSKTYRKYSKSNNIPFYKARKYFSAPWMKMIHKDIIGKRRFDVRFKNGEDNLFMFLISDKMRHVSFTDNNAIYYRRLRSNSAVSVYRSFGKRIKNSLLVIWQYILIYKSNPLNYNFNFFCTRILAGCHKILDAIRMQIKY